MRFIRSSGARGAVVLLAVAAVLFASGPVDAQVDPVGGVAAGSSLDPALVAKLDAELDKAFAASGMPGVTAALWIPGQGEWVATRGVSDVETSEPMNRANQ